MKRSKIYILIPIAAFILIFTIAAVCGQTPAERGTEGEQRDLRDPDVLISGRQEEEPDEAPPAEDVDQDPDQNQEEAQVDQEEEDEDFPSIVLVVYEGPSYSPGDDICFYRVKAEIGGDPQPRVEFSKDDSRGAWGPLRAQVNLTRQNPTYTLRAEATNKHGTVEDTLTLNWGCGGDTAAIDPGWQQVASVSGQASADMPEGETTTDYFDIESHFWRISWSAQHVPAMEGEGFIEIRVSDEHFFIDSISQSISPGETRQSMLLSPGNAGIGNYNVAVKYRNAAFTVTIEQNMTEMEE